MQTLPIDSYLEEIKRAVDSNPVVIVEAPPGTGKTTRVAPMLMQSIAGDVSRSKLYLLQPRRLAARSVTERIAYEQGVGIGSKVGYQVRFDSRVSADTQLIVATEGILLRRLQADPAIEDTRIVLLDEFHERSLDADLLFGMLRRVQETLREDLRIVIMSATIDSDLMASRLPDAPVISVESRTYPVKVHYKPMNPKDVFVEHVATSVIDALSQYDGDALVFLPGAGEIHRVADILSQRGVSPGTEIVPLYGAMNIEEQARAISPGSRRRVVLATNVAETSITIEGVRVVVDGGQARVMRFSPEVGLDRLSLEGISQASATQRAGRAGRVAPGVCVRLWSESAERSRSPHLDPEIRRLDLASAVLQLYAWGEGAGTDFPWLEEPRMESWEAAVFLLENLGALKSGKITAIGNQISRLPLHPRLSRMVLESAERGCLDRGALLAAMLSERDPFIRRGDWRQPVSLKAREAPRWESDCVERLVAIEAALRGYKGSSPFGEVNYSAARSIAQAAEQIVAQVRGLFPMNEDLNYNDADPDELSRSLLAGYPDRLARRRAVGRANGLMVGGKGVALSRESGVQDPEFFLCIDVESGRGADAVVRQASGVNVDWILSGLVTSDELFFHPSQKQVVARRQTRWIDLVLQETPTSVADNSKASELLFQAVKQHWASTFPVDNEPLNSLVSRINWLRDWIPELELPLVDISFLQEVAQDLCHQKRALHEVKDGPWLDWLRAKLTAEQLKGIEKEAPARMELPSGKTAKIDYEPAKPPVLAVKIQEVFSWKSTPRIARGRVPLLLHLLSPAMRPQQVTDDLASFWANGYHVVKKELKRRYPKHSWPDNPSGE